MHITTRLLVLLFVAQNASAQDASSGEDPRVQLTRALTLRASVLRGVAHPLGELGPSSPNSQLLLLVQKDGEVAAKARLGIIRGNFLADVVLSGPLSGGQGVLADRAGLGSSASVRLRTQWVSWGGPTIDLKRLIAVAPTVAQTLTATRIAGEAGVDPLRLVAATIDKKAVSELGVGYQSPLVTSAERLTSAAEAPWNLYVRAFERDFERYLQASVVRPTRSFFVSASYETASHAFEFVDALTLADTSANRTTHAFEGSAGLLLPPSEPTPENPGVYFGFSAVRFGRFRARAEKEVCRPLGTTGGFECGKWRIGEPRKQMGESLSAETRLWLLSARLGLNPRLQYDFQDDSWKVEMPAYFMRLVADITKPIFSGVPDLVGGVTTGWRSGTDGGAYVYFFIGPSFKLPEPRLRTSHKDSRTVR